MSLFPCGMLVEMQAQPVRPEFADASLAAAIPYKQPLTSPRWHIPWLLALWLLIFVSSLWSPPLLDDADATHAQAAQAMLRTGDWVTLHVDGIRYLEKPPLPYWIAAGSMRIFGFSAFAVHLPLALEVLALALLAYFWSRSAAGSRTALYAGTAVLTSTGVFLFTRIFIPEALLSLLLGVAIYALLRVLDASETRVATYAHGVWAAMALAVLTKGLIAVVFLLSTAAVYLAITGEWRQWRRLHPFTGMLLFLVIAAPWHIVAGLRNTGGAGGHGFFWFYFINEHVLRFLGRRLPRDYNKLPWYLYWSLHLVWLFPWSLFAPAAAFEGWHHRRDLLRPRNDAQRTALLLVIFSSLLLLFFSLSTNQEYYTFPAYLPLLMLLTHALTKAEGDTAGDRRLPTLVRAGHAAFACVGLLAAAALAHGLWNSRSLPFVPDVGSVLARRGVGNYTLSMSHFFDLTSASFAALRLPALLAACVLATGPLIAWFLRVRHKHLSATLSMALTSAVFLFAAHLALVRFTSLLSSENCAQRIVDLERQGLIDSNTQVLLYGDQAYGSSIPFYLARRVELVDGRSTSMLFGSTFPDAPPIFWTPDALRQQWGNGPRKLLFLPQEKRDEVDKLLGVRQTVLEESSGKALITDRPLHLTEPRRVDTLAGAHKQ